MKDCLTLEQFSSERITRLHYPDPITSTEECWEIDVLAGGLATFLWEGEIYEGTLDEMEKKLFELASDESKRN